ncbi:MAG: GLUG motif-containing protein [Chitinophagales bacterium]
MVNRLRKNVLRGLLLFLLMCGMLSFYTSAAIAATDTWDGTIDTGFAGGDGSSDTPYLIAKGKQLAYLAKQTNASATYSAGKYFKLTADIDLNNEEWTPIGTVIETVTYTFAGTFDGDGHVISNLKIDSTTAERSGLFGQLSSSAKVKNLGVEVIDINNTCTIARIGGLAGACYDPVTIENCYVSGSITGGDPSGTQYVRAGGLVGQYYGNGSIIANCYSKVDVSIKGSCFAAGGLVAEQGNESTVTNCYATGTITCTGTARYGVGGLIGRLACGTVSNSYWNSDAMTTGIGTIGGTSTGSTGKPSTEMQAGAFVILLNANRGSNVEWKLDTESKNGGYPVLSNVGAGRASITVPTTQASTLTSSDLMGTGMTINWTNGDGASRAVFVKEGNGDITNPSDSSTYTASADWSSKGTQLGTSDYYCVYNGTGSSVSLTNLSPGTSYTVQVFEYNGSAGSEKYLTTTATGNPNAQTTHLVTYKGTQKRTNGSNYDIRFIATINTLEPDSVGFVYSTTNTTPTIGGSNTQQVDTTTVYNSIIANEITIDAAGLGVDYIIACPVTAVSNDSTFYVRAYTTTDSETVYTAVFTVTVSGLS